MKLLLSVALACLLLTEPLELRFAPTSGLVLTKTLEQTLALGFEGMTSEMDGRPVPQQYLPQMEIDLIQEGRLVVVDEYEQTNPGRPSRLRRLYESIEARASEDIVVDPYYESSRSGSATSQLEGKTVIFEWDGDADTYTREFAADGDEALLEGLAEDLDLRSLLPEDEVEIGDSWEIEAADLEGLFSPGGDLALEWDEEMDVKRDPKESSGELVLVLERVREQDGVQVAELALSGEVVTKDVRAGDLEDIPVADGTATETSITTFELEGQLIWNLDGGYLVELALDCPVNIESRTEKDPGQPGPEFSSTLTLRGTWELALSVTRQDPD